MEGYCEAPAACEPVSAAELGHILYGIWLVHVSGQITEAEYGTAADAIEGWWMDIEGIWTCEDGIWEPVYPGLE